MATEQIEIEGLRVGVSKTDKVLYPATGTTKGAVIDYYRRVAPYMLPLMAGHPLTRKRFPDGVASKGFFEKNCPPYHPEWMETVAVQSRRVDNKQTEYCVVQTVAGLVWLANLAALEIHPALHLAEDLEHPRYLVFDLDPGEPAGLRECVDLAKRLKGLLEHLGLQPFVKLSGGKGLHLWVPVVDADYEQTKDCARTVAESLQRDDPERVVARMRKTDRTGRILIDWSQNDRNKTTVAAYSLRAREQPTVSLPVHWDELLRARKPERLRLTLEPALQRIEREGDPWAGMAEAAAPIPDADGMDSGGRGASSDGR